MPNGRGQKEEERIGRGEEREREKGEGREGVRGGEAHSPRRVTERNSMKRQLTRFRQELREAKRDRATPQS